MDNISLKKVVVLGLFMVLSSSSCVSVFAIKINDLELNNNQNFISNQDIKYIEIELFFSDPEILKYGDYWIVRIKETNYNRIILFNFDPGKPVLPVNISIFELVFGSKILEVKYENSAPEIIDLPGKLAFCKAEYDTIKQGSNDMPMDSSIYESSDPYPDDWVSYHTGGGLSDGKHTTFLGLRVYPVRYYPVENQLQFIRTISINISYIEPVEPVIKDNNIYDLLIISPLSFERHLKPLVEHKNKFGVSTKLVTLDYVYSHIWYGRDKAEKIKLFIKEAIEDAGIEYVLLVGGIKGQTFLWNLPVRYSHVVPTEEGDSSELSFISDLYYADIYDSKGEFSSWDSNNDNVFSVWNGTFKEEMDLYPDVYFGRLPCMNIFEVKVMVKKIINYEKEKQSDKNWFKNLVLISGDSYNDTAHYNEGELICEKAVELMPEFNPVRVYANDSKNVDINRYTVNNAMNNGSGFAYFCGHGNVYSWSTHFPPATDEGGNWTTGYLCKDMVYLKNKEKLPITVVGGCHNAQYDVTMWNIIRGIRKEGLHYFSSQKGNFGGFYYPRYWIPNCWAWWLTSKVGGGSIATIANTGLGTHGDGDLDNNTIPDYLEILDGWLELNFLKLYATDQNDILGENHGDTITGYLHRFLGDDTKTDVKVVQQWQLFGDPSLKIGGYE